MSGQEISPELVERMVALVRAYGHGAGLAFEQATGRSVFAEAMLLADLLPEPVDPDLIEAREIVASGHDVYAAESPWHANEAVKVRAGQDDRLFRVADTFAGIKRGRELERAAS